MHACIYLPSLNATINTHTHTHVHVHRCVMHMKANTYTCMHPKKKNQYGSMLRMYMPPIHKH